MYRYMYGCIERCQCVWMDLQMQICIARKMYRCIDRQMQKCKNKQIARFRYVQVQICIARKMQTCIDRQMRNVKINRCIDRCLDVQIDVDMYRCRYAQLERCRHVQIDSLHRLHIEKYPLIPPTPLFRFYLDNVSRSLNELTIKT